MLRVKEKRLRIAQRMVIEKLVGRREVDVAIEGFACRGVAGKLLVRAASVDPGGCPGALVAKAGNDEVQARLHNTTGQHRVVSQSVGFQPQRRSQLTARGTPYRPAVNCDTMASACRNVQVWVGTELTKALGHQRLCGLNY